MKRKQKDDIMGEDQSDLPVVEGLIRFNYSQPIPLTKFQCLEDVLPRLVHQNKPSFINYKHEVLMNRQLHFIDVWIVRNSGENTEVIM